MNVSVTWHRGPEHVCEAINDVMRATLPGRQLEGIPIREAFPEPQYRPLIEIMDACYRTGEEQWALFRHSPYAVLPRWRGGQVIGVTTVYLVPRVRPLTRLAALPPLAPASRAATALSEPRWLERVG